MPIPTRNFVLLAVFTLILILAALFGQKILRSEQSAPNIASQSPTTLTDNRQTETCSGQPSPSLTEGPYYKTGSPKRTSLIESETVGTKLTISGYVFARSAGSRRARNCQPIANARLDFWQADGNGNYDNTGYKLRGHQFTDSSGRYQLETVIPGQYSSRTPHIHVKMQAQDGPILTTQLFFPERTKNQTDSIFNEQLQVKMQNTGEATFNFVINY